MCHRNTEGDAAARRLRNRQAHGVLRKVQTKQAGAISIASALKRSRFYSSAAVAMVDGAFWIDCKEGFAKKAL
jgi:hypothetical protein